MVNFNLRYSRTVLYIITCTFVLLFLCGTLIAQDIIQNETIKSTNIIKNQTILDLNNKEVKNKTHYAEYYGDDVINANKILQKDLSIDNYENFLNTKQQDNSNSVNVDNDALDEAQGFQNAKLKIEINMTIYQIDQKINNINSKINKADQLNLSKQKINNLEAQKNDLINNKNELLDKKNEL